jgi:hypothetical protein
VSFYDDAAGDSEPLTASTTDLFGSEEGLEELVVNVLRYTATGVAHRDHDLVAFAVRANTDSALLTVGRDRISNSVSGVYQEVEKDLVHALPVTLH